MTPHDLSDVIAGLGSFMVAAIALWRSFRNDGRHWIEKLFQEAKCSAEEAKTEQKAYRTQMETVLDKLLSKREFERHESDQREDLAAIRNGQERVLEKIDELKDIMIGRHR